MCAEAENEAYRRGIKIDFFRLAITGQRVCARRQPWRRTCAAPRLTPCSCVRAQSPLWCTVYGKGLVGDFERSVGRRDVEYPFARAACESM